MGIQAATPDETPPVNVGDGDSGMPARRFATRLGVPLLLVASAAVGAAAATSCLLLSGTLADAHPVPTWGVSTALVGLVGAIWFAGAVLAVVLASSATRPTRAQGWIAAFGLAPFAVALFFFVVGVGVTGGVPGGYFAVAVILAFAIFARRLLSAISEKLLVAFFVWLGLLVMPVIWSDPVNTSFSAFLLDLLRTSGVIV